MEPTPPVHILLVEDSENDAVLLENHLREHGLALAMSRVADLPSLQKALGETRWDVLLTDFDLPDMDGFQILEEAGRLAPGLPCILVSGHVAEETAVEALRAGAKDFVSKARLARLLPAIRREVDERRARVRADETRVELRTAEDRLRAITTAALDGIVMMDAGGIVSFWNQAAERIFGYSEAEALGSDMHALVAPVRFHAAFESGFRGFRGTGQGRAIGKVLDLEARRKDGTEFPVEISLAALQEGEAWHAVGVVRDITARKALERDQLEHLQFLRTLLETLPNPLYYEDVEGHILECNKAFQEFLGLSAESIIGRKSADILPEAEAEIREAPAGRQPGPFETSFRMGLPDGRARHAIFRKAPFYQADGQPAGQVATLLDITRLKEVEEALRRNEWLFSAIHRHVMDLVAIIDGEGRRIYTSPSYQFVLGYSEQEMSALSATELLHPDDSVRVAEAIRGLMEGRPSQGLEYRLQHKDGRWLHFESRAAIIPDSGTGDVRALLVARDVTERKAAEQNRAAMEVQLRQSQKLEAIGQLAAGIAHEINTPTQFLGDNTAFLRDAFKEAFDLVGKLSSRLASIAQTSGAGAEEARQALADLGTTDIRYLQEEIPKAIQQSLDGVGRISKIVKAMKDFSHPGGESKTLTDLHRAIESTITVSRNEWKYAANVVTEFDPDLPLVPCYPGEFNQVILNLIVNAVHAIESAKAGKDPALLGRITVKTRARKDEVEVSVADDGTGIPEAVQARMFDPFFTTKPVGKGSGQGLSLAHAVIVEKHQGRIQVESELGRGTTFILHLPLKVNELEGAAG